MRENPLSAAGIGMVVPEGAPGRLRRSTVFGIIFLAALLVTIGYHTYGAIAVSFPYEREVGGHVRNAYEVNTPEAMIAELDAAVAGMRRLGLSEDRYAAYFPWEQTPDRAMSFQYSYIDQLINRTEAVILWRTLAYSGNSTPETLGDVYEQKMDNLRTFMTEGCGGEAVCTDWIAREVYFLHFWTPWYFGGLFNPGSFLILFVSFLGFVSGLATAFPLRVRRIGPRVWTGRQIRGAIRWLVLPIFILGALLMSLPFVFGALGP